MNKHILNCFALGAMALMAVACGESESDLLEPKVYFESKEYNITVEDDQNEIAFNLSSRLSSKAGADVQVSYAIADSTVVEAYNAKYGTNFEMFDASKVSLSSENAVIPGGKLFSESVQLSFTDLNNLEEGKPFILPVRVISRDASTEVGTDLAYFFVTKPLKLKKAGSFSYNYISVKFPVGTMFESFTYEALINVSWFTGNSTIMGTEGVMIFRIGDSGGGVPRDVLQAAGRQNYYTKDKLSTGRWYHVALTYEKASGKTAIYVNGEKWAESAWAIDGVYPNDDCGFNIGMIPGFQWGERPFNGMMCELRVWSVARTQNQLQQNMLSVDPKSDGLEMYYKLNGSEKVQGGKIKDSTGKIEGSTSGLRVVDLESPIEIK